MKLLRNSSQFVARTSENSALVVRSNGATLSMLERVLSWTSNRIFIGSRVRESDGAIVNRFRFERIILVEKVFVHGKLCNGKRRRVVTALKLSKQFF